MSTRPRFSHQERLKILQDVHLEDIGRARRFLDAGVAAAQAEWVPRGALLDALRQIETELSQPAKSTTAYDA